MSLIGLSAIGVAGFFLAAGFAFFIGILQQPLLLFLPLNTFLVESLSIVY
jgi:hypothetical protein